VSAGHPPFNVVILGNTGFVGGRLQAYVAERGVRVTGFGSRELDLRENQALHRLDGLLGLDTLVVAASAAGAGSSMTARGLAENVLMVANLVDYLQSRPVRRCIFLSSDAVYAMGDTPIVEDAALDLSSLYGLSKYACERLVQQVLGRTSTKTVVLRPTAVFGPGDSHNAYGPNRFVRAVARGETVQLFGAGEETRDHLYVDDLVRAVVDLDAAEFEGTVNVASGLSRSFGSVIDTLTRLTGSEPRIESLPRRGAITHRSFNISRLRATLPRLEFTPFEDAVRITLQAAVAETAAA
jgi:UDP-glucose 4-epimerase